MAIKTHEGIIGATISNYEHHIALYPNDIILFLELIVLKDLAMTIIIKIQLY